MINDNEYKTVYNEFLQKIEKRLLEIVPDIEPKEVYEPFKYLLEGGGKRIRPVLTMIAAGAAGADPDIAVDCGSAIEILHNFTLVHDDIMDKSEMRRGRPTVHIKWNEAVGILSGDIMVGYAYSLLPKKKDHPFADEIFSAFTKGLIDVCEGQAYDMEFGFKQDVSIDDYFLMIGKKTSSLIISAVVMGAYLGCCTVEDAEKFGNYAKFLGLAFQVQDDLLDLTAEQLKLGKKIGQDILEGKKTYLMLKAREKAKSQEDILVINKFFKKNGLPESYIETVKEMFVSLGVIEDTELLVDKLTNSAKDALKGLIQNKYTVMLMQLADSLNKRKF